MHALTYAHTHPYTYTHAHAHTHTHTHIKKESKTKLNDSKENLKNENKVSSEITEKKQKSGRKSKKTDIFQFLQHIYPYAWSTILPIFQKCVQKGKMVGEVPIRQFVTDLYADKQVCVCMCVCMCV